MSICSYVIGGILILLGGLMILHAFRSWRLGIRSLEFPQTAGRVVRSEVVDSGTGFIDVRSDPIFRYRPELEIEYYVDGKPYRMIGVGTDTNLFLSGDDLELVKKSLALFPLGRELDVFFNPQKPSEALLYPERPDKIETVLMGLFGIALMFLGWNGVACAR